MGLEVNNSLLGDIRNNIFNNGRSNNSTANQSDIDQTTNRAGNIVEDINNTNTPASNTPANVTQTSTEQNQIINEMEQSFVQSFTGGELDEYDPRAIMIAAEFTKLQFQGDEERNEIFSQKLAEFGLSGLDDQVKSEIAMQAIDIVDAFESGDEDTSEKMKGDLTDALLLDRDFDSEANKARSNFDTDALNTVFNLADLDEPEIEKVYTISAYTTSTWQTHDSLTVSEMLADFSGQESEHDSWWHNKGAAVNAGGGFSDHNTHNSDKSNDAELRELKQLMQETNPELLDLTFDQGEAYIFGKTSDGKIKLLSVADGDQLGAKRSYTHHNFAGYEHMNLDTAHNEDFEMLDDSKLNITGYINGHAGAGGYNGAEEFSGKTSMKIGDMLLEDVETMSIHRMSTPLILDLDGDGIDLSSKEDGVTFDLTGDGVRDETAWTDAQNTFDDAFLVLDKNNDGQVNSGKELFGDQNGEDNGFDELATYDTNNDGVINSDDEVFEDLKLWADMDADGKVGEGEMKSLAELGIKSLNTGFTGEKGDVTDEYGNDLSMQGSFTREVNGEEVEGSMVDALFVNQDAEAQNLDDIVAILSKKMSDYEDRQIDDSELISGIKKENNGNASGSSYADNTIRQGGKKASEEVQKLTLENELATINSQLGILNSELSGLEGGGVNAGAGVTQGGNNQGSATNNNVANTNAGTNSTNAQTNTGGASQTNNNAGIDSVRTEISDLESERLSIQARLSSMGD
ncbi:MAG: hypothetical protein HRT47_03220 [Candidatus Caenarcaniphilales bacterium]|nr:hypothetical protein [Candidatus Caenarcaniphilales bacterium]